MSEYDRAGKSVSHADGRVSPLEQEAGQAEQSCEQAASRGVQAVDVLGPLLHRGRVQVRSRAARKLLSGKEQQKNGGGHAFPEKTAGGTSKVPPVFVGKAK